MNVEQPPYQIFQKGDKVRSVAVGSAPAFIGVVESYNTYKSVGNYTVRDYTKRRWIRDASELEHA